MKTNEKILDLGCKGLKIIQDSSLYTFTSDAVILANFLKLKQGECAIEIGGGSGVVSILASAKNDFKSIDIFEIQKELQKLCDRNIKLNNLEDKLSLVCDDIKNFKNYIEKPVDVVFSNPPYFKLAKNFEGTVRERARQEYYLNLEELVEVSSKLLKFGGRFYVVYPAERSAELISLCSRAQLEIKKMFYTENGKGQINLVVIEAVKGAKPGVKVLPNLRTNDEDGKYLKELETRKLFN